MIKDEFDRRERSDVNAVQALLLYNIGDKELTAGELRTCGYYLGSNVSYNVKKLVEMGFLHHARSRVDRRSVRISLTEKGREVHEIVVALYDKHAMTVEQIGGVVSDDFSHDESIACAPRALLGGPDQVSPLIGHNRSTEKGRLLASLFAFRGPERVAAPVTASRAAGCGHKIAR